MDGAAAKVGMDSRMVGRRRADGPRESAGKALTALALVSSSGPRSAIGKTEDTEKADSGSVGCGGGER